jgi:hypothetical protein
MPDHMDMKGASMDPLAAMPAEARELMMQADEDIAAVLLARLANMSPQELQSLDAAITPAVAGVLMKLLPELAQIIDAVGAGQMPQQSQPQMGALGGM